MEYKCSVCQKKIKGDVLVYINHTEQHILDEIKAKHPEWIEKDGLCGKCVAYYREQMKGRDVF